jgi:hypothetical protein
MTERTTFAISDSEAEEQIRFFFERNLQQLQAEGAHALAPGPREMALQQVLLYWKKLRALAEQITDTEVKLNLPDQQTPNGKKFSIEGVVDIVREEDRTTLYDIKTHDPVEVRANINQYAAQLNLYAFIWQGLRGEPLDATSIICTAFPAPLREAVDSHDSLRVEQEFRKWDPVVEISLSGDDVKATVRAFADVVDRIQQHDFAPKSLEDLRQPTPGMRRPFGTTVCRNCDARFSCGSYRVWLQVGPRSSETTFRRYIEDLGSDGERLAFVEAALQTSISSDDLD